MSSIGPSIPAHLLSGSKPSPISTEKTLVDPPQILPTDDDSDDSDSFAPALPPDIVPARRIIGPSFPTGPPPQDDDSSDDDYGPTPLPEGAAEPEYDPVKEFMEKEERRRKNAEVSHDDRIEVASHATN